jgi:hypothetical protein
LTTKCDGEKIAVNPERRRKRERRDEPKNGLIITEWGRSTKYGSISYYTDGQIQNIPKLEERGRPDVENSRRRAPSTAKVVFARAVDAQIRLQ